VGDKWFLITVVVVFFLLLGIGVGQLWPDSFQSSTLFMLRAAKLVDDSDLEKAINFVSIAAKQRTLILEIRSHARIEKVLRRLEWTEFIKAQMDPKELITFYGKVGSRLDVQLLDDGVGGTQVEISFTWNDPFKAAEFCNEVRNSWIDNKLESYMEDNLWKLEQAEVVLRQRKEDYHKAQQALEKFDNDTLFSSMGTLEELNRLQTELEIQATTSEAKVLSLGGQIADLENQLAVLPQKIELEQQKKNPEWEKAYREWQLNSAAYNQKRQRLTESNPELVKLREAMEVSKEKLDELEPYKYIVEGLEGTINPEYSNKSATLTQLKPEYETAKETFRLNKERLIDVKEKIALLPSLMAEREYLQGEIDLTKELYQQAAEGINPIRERVSSFKTVQKAGAIWQPQSTFKSQTFEVLNNAVPATSPKNPMMIIIIAAFTIIGLGLGLVLSLAGEILKSSFSTPEEVMSFLKKPVLGSVNRIMTAAEIRSIKWKKILFTSTPLVMIFCLIAVLYICNRYPQLIPPSLVEQVNQIRESLG